MKKCYSCNQFEVIFRKIHFTQVKGQRIPVKNANDFSICINEKCYRYMNIELHKEIINEADNEVFVWYRPDNFFSLDNI